MVPLLQRLAPGLTICLLFFPSELPAAALDYEGFLSGVKVGSATLSIEQDRERYRITGRAATNGLAAIFSHWQSEFHASGRFVDGRPHLSNYGYDERQGRRHKILSLSAGEVRQIRNGRARPRRSVPDGIDVLTAFFIRPACWDAQTLHTGRHEYRIEGQSAPEAGTCDYRVTDEDGETVRFRVQFEIRDGLRVPVRVTTRGWLRATIVLKDPPAPPVTMARRPAEDS